MSNPKHDHCPDCESSKPSPGRTVSRRDFAKLSIAGVAAAAAAGTGFTVPARARAAAAAKKPSSETVVASLYKSLTDEQRGSICFPLDHALRSEINNNWFITRLRTGEDFTKDQQAMIKDIFMGLHSEEYAEAVLGQVNHDNRCKDLGDTSIAIFGEPGTGKFQFVLAARHTTRRCDGDSVEGAAFGGPIFYGHAAGSFNEKPDHPGNIYWYQAKRANELYKALDSKQQKVALLDKARPEQKTATVKLAGKDGKIEGLPASELSSDQKDLLKKVMADVLAPFRKEDADESMKLIEAGGFDKVHISYFSNKSHDVGGDGVWDVWQLESPNMIWYFRGAPHVHTWVNIKAPEA